MQLFFVASGFTLAMMWESRKDGAVPFYIRRFFRIAPAFWVAIVAYLAIDGFGPRYWAPDGIGWPHVLATATFLFGLWPSTINSVVPGGWSIANEMLFYAMFPVVIAACREWRITAALLCASILFADFQLRIFIRAFRSMLTDHDPGLVANFVGLWLPNQLPAFIGGILALQVWRRWGAQIQPLAVKYTMACAGIAIALALWARSMTQIHLAYSIVFSAAILSAVSITKPVPPFLIHIGRVSYGAYLWHFAVLKTGVIESLRATGLTDFSLFVVGCSAVSAVTIACASASYYLIEQPGIKLGHKLASAAGSIKIEKTIHGSS